MHPIRFLHISDTHFGSSTDYVYHGKNPYLDALSLIKEIKELPCQIDFIIHTGDVISFQSQEAYALASETLKAINVPMYFTTGNHDDPIQLNEFPLFAKRTALVDNVNSVSYYFEHSQVLFIGIDAKHPDNQNPSGVISDEQVIAIKNFLATNQKNFCIFTHFPLIPLDAPWMDKHLLVSNGDVVHEMLSKNSKRCRGVFFGHIHQNLQIVRDGIFYCAVPSNTFQFGGWPTDEKISHNPQGKAAMNLVTITEQSTIVKSLGFERNNAFSSLNN
jgi:Icc protein